MINIATLGMFGGTGGGGQVITGAGGIPPTIVRKEYAEFNKPSILIEKVEFDDKVDQGQLQRSIVVKSVK